jgi:hypothetical protein
VVLETWILRRRGHSAICLRFAKVLDTTHELVFQKNSMLLVLEILIGTRLIVVQIHDSGFLVLSVRPSVLLRRDKSANTCTSSA